MLLFVLVACVDLDRVPVAFAANGKVTPRVTRVDRTALRETVTRRDGVQVERSLFGCEHLDITLSWRELKGPPPPHIRALAQRAIKEIEATPFVPGEPASKKLRAALQAALQTMPASTKMNAPIRFDCGPNAACSFAIGGALGHGFSIFLHHDHDAGS